MNIEILSSHKNNRLTIAKNRITLKLAADENRDIYIRFIEKLVSKIELKETLRGKIQIHNNQVRFSTDYGVYFYTLNEL